MKLARFSNLRTKILHHISTWFIQEACFGVVEDDTVRWIGQKRGPRGH